MFSTLLRVVAWLPLPIIQGLGAALGMLVYWCSPTYRRRLRNNLAASGIPGALALAGSVARETGKSVLELAAIWFADKERVMRWTACDDWPLIKEAYARGKGVILLTPHLGGYEVSALYAAQRMTLAVMYRKPKMRWLEPPMLTGRARFGAEVVPATTRGVRAFLQTLRAGGAVGMLPDQTPAAGDGVWAPFFGRPAYTMTLIRRLQAATGAALFIIYTERLPRGTGFRIHCEEIPAQDFDEAALNRAVEGAVRRCPAQYLWGYNRYKRPAGAPPPPSLPTPTDSVT